MSTKKNGYVVVADERDFKALKGQKPVFTLAGKEYFNGDPFVPPASFVENMDEFDGNGIRFGYKYQMPQEDGAVNDIGEPIMVEVIRSMILPVKRVGEGEAVSAGDGEAEAKPPKAPKVPKKQGG